MRSALRLLVALVALSGIPAWLFALHPSLWQSRSLHLGGRPFTERSLDLGRGKLHVLRDLLSPSEASHLLSLVQSCEAGANELCEDGVGHPVRTPCHVLADDLGWKKGALSDLLRPIVETWLLPYMKLALGCDALAVAQLLVRHYLVQETPRSFPAHNDHMAFGTAVIDLTPVPRSGLWVATGSASGSDGSGSGGSAFFVPLGARDVAVHGWDVVHGIQLKEDHERISVVLWTRPAEDLRSGLCSWYLAGALKGDTEAAFHLGVEAWRQRLLGSLKLKILEETLQAPVAASASASASLRALGGPQQAEQWKRQCQEVARRVQDLHDEAEALKEGQMMKDLGKRLGARDRAKTGVAAVRSALRRGWDHARNEMEMARAAPSTSPASLRASIDNLHAAAELLETAGVAVFDEKADRVAQKLLEDWHQEFQKYWEGEVFPRLCRLSEADRESFQFREVCSRSAGRFDVRMPGPDMTTGSDLPWLPLVRASLGDAKELSRGVLLSNYGSKTQEWHRDSEHLFQMSLPMHAMTIFVPLEEPISSLGFPSFLPGSHRVATLPTASANAATPLLPARGAWLAFDNRLVHRGEANVDHQHQRDRPLLYFVYAKPWFQDVRNFPPDAASLFEADRQNLADLGDFYTL